MPRPGIFEDTNGDEVKRLTLEQLRERQEWERCAANAYEVPDETVLAMIDEILDWRRNEARID